MKASVMDSLDAGESDSQRASIDTERVDPEKETPEEVLQEEMQIDQEVLQEMEIQRPTEFRSSICEFLRMKLD